MPVLPSLEIGFLNLWIFTILIFLIPELINKLTGNGWRRACRLPKMSGYERGIYFTWIGVNIIVYIYSVFVPLAVGTFYFYVGLFVFVVSAVVLGLGTWAYQTTPEEELITKGIYQFSRNPGYFGTFCAYVGMGLMGKAWPVIGLALIHLIMYQVITRYEERMCLELYPVDFQRYKATVKKNFVFF